MVNYYEYVVEWYGDDDCGCFERKIDRGVLAAESYDNAVKRTQRHYGSSLYSVWLKYIKTDGELGVTIDHIT